MPSMLGKERRKITESGFGSLRALGRRVLANIHAFTERRKVILKTDCPTKSGENFSFNFSHSLNTTMLNDN